MVLLDDEILLSAKLTEQEIRIELAILLYAQKRLTFGQARKLAGLEHPEFEKLLFDRQVPPHYDVAEFEEDLKTIEQIQHLRHSRRQ
ncbi:MAG: UPF0175 family protein [Lewinellaceae bacterium]|nr:UPF0175 family protein [Lewinellaceae bacterium]